ncbi:hypothetical protein AAE478_008182 [Parahypoxylon ruwenzoriense]
MDVSPGLDFHKVWNQQEVDMKRDHGSELASHKSLLEKNKQEARADAERKLQALKPHLPPEIYDNICLPMAHDSLMREFQRIEDKHKLRVDSIERVHKEELARHRSNLHGTIRLGTTNGEQLSSPTPNIPLNAAGTPGAEGDEAPQHQHGPSRPFKLFMPFTCTVQHQIVWGKRCLMMRMQSRKRGPPGPEGPPKRPRLNTSINLMHTPNIRPSIEAPERAPSELEAPGRTATERIITFMEVYQNGNAEYKDTIVEWPTGSRMWYILKCEEHGLHFKKNPIQGAARHLNSVSHGFPNRNWGGAVKALGYRVVDCSENLAHMNNQIAEGAYAEGTAPQVYNLYSRSRNPRERRAADIRGSAESSSPRTVEPAASLTQETISVENSATEERRESVMPARSQASPNSWDGITNPKTFHIYHGLWRDDDQFYPVMILGWDDLKGSGLKESNLASTGLLEKYAHPPSCYIYGPNKIVGWAPGYEDGGPKVRLRKFPVMFFDSLQTVAWILAQDLRKFPLYRRGVPQRNDHPINAARRWIAEREGFGTWEDRERARLSTLEASSLPSPINRAGSYAEITFPIAERNGLSMTIINPDISVNDDDLDDSNSESGARWSASPDTMMMLEELREKGGEIPGDDDFVGSPEPEVNVDDSLDSVLRDWSVDGRTSTFYNLRPKPAVGGAHEAQTGYSSQSQTESMDSARRLREQGCSPSSGFPATIEPPSPLDLLAASVVDPKEQNAAETTPSINQSERLPTGNVIPSEPARQEDRENGRDSGSSLGQEIGQAFDLVRQGRHLTAITEGTESTRKLPSPRNVCMASPIPTRASHELPLDARATDETLFTQYPPAVVTADMTPLPADPDFELSLYSDGITSWKRPNWRENCVKLFRSVDRRTMWTRCDLIKATIDPTRVSVFWRENLPGLNENAMLVLKNKDGSTLKLAFDRSAGSKLENGRIQTRRFIQWLRSVNADINVLEQGST